MTKIKTFADYLDCEDDIWKEIKLSYYIEIMNKIHKAHTQWKHDDAKLKKEQIDYITDEEQIMESIRWDAGFNEGMIHIAEKIKSLFDEVEKDES